MTGHLQIVKPEQQPDDEPAEWMQRFIRGKSRKIEACGSNIRLVLENASEWKGRLARSVFAGNRVVYTGQGRLPVPFGTREPGAEWATRDDLALQEYLCREYRFRVPPSTDRVREALEGCVFQDYSPVIAYLDGLTWDGVPRISSWLTTYCGADPASTAPLVGRWWLIGAVARGYRPGEQVDSALILESPEQGMRKSSLVRALVPELEWFTDQIGEIGTKDTDMQLAGRWIVELAELATIQSARDMERVKSFLSRRIDKYRPPYGRDVIACPRTCAFIGTTNKCQYITDPSGARRFWPVRVDRIDIDGVLAARDQLWAEAVAEYREGKRWYPETGDEIDRLESTVDSRAVVDAWEDLLCTMLLERTYVNLPELYQTLGVEPERRNGLTQARLLGILRRFGFVHYRRCRLNGIRAYWYGKRAMDDPEL